MTPLVTPTWLTSRLQNPNTIVLDATLPPVGITPPIDTRSRYLDRHIPGAVFFDIDDLSDHAISLPHMLPTAEDFSRSMSSLGVGDNMTIVVYEQEGIFSAPRAWWMLRTFGAQHVHILDGDFRAWTKAGLPTESGPVRHAAASFHATLDRDAVTSLSQLRDSIANHRQILDARSAGRFNGAAPEPRPNLSSGHMPGAINVPFTELAENGRLKPADKLREFFLAKNIDLKQPITATCGSGVTAAVIALSLEIVGAQDVSLYDGSWAEYAQQPNSVIEKNT